MAEHDDAPESESESDFGSRSEAFDAALEADEISELSLEDLGAAFARVAAQHNADDFAAQQSPGDEQAGEEIATLDSESAGMPAGDDDHVVTPGTIIEAALFVGHPESKSLSEQRLASLMRDVTPQEVEELIDQLNQSYREADQALRIVRDEQGYRMSIAPEVEGVRRSFLGKVREAKLNQAAIEVLALVAYQPGITAQLVQDQRGRESNALLSQLVRRQLLRMERKPAEEGGKKVPHYFTTERFLVLFGLESLDDLPQVEEGLREGQ